MIRPRSCIAMLFRGHFDFYEAYAFIVSFSSFFVDFRFFFCKFPFSLCFYFLYISACCCMRAASSK